MFQFFRKMSDCCDVSFSLDVGTPWLVDVVEGGGRSGVQGGG